VEKQIHTHHKKESADQEGSDAKAIEDKKVGNKSPHSAKQVIYLAFIVQQNGAACPEYLRLVFFPGKKIGDKSN
jgi:hypothetical protein